MSLLSTNKLRRLPLDLPKLYTVFPGFELGDFAILRGNTASYMLFLLSVRAQFSPEQGGLGSSITFVDGGNTFNPYFVAEIARSYGLNAKEALENICVSRAFTAYQLSSLILEKLDFALKRNKAKLLIVSDITSLFLDRDVPKTEANELFMKACAKLSEIASKKQVITIVSHFPERSMHGLFLEAVLFGRCNVSIKVRKTGKVLAFTLEDHSRLKPFSMDFAVDDSSLASFMEV